MKGELLDEVKDIGRQQFVYKCQKKNKVGNVSKIDSRSWSHCGKTLVHLLQKHQQ
jgi:hypothetical protein